MYSVVLMMALSGGADAVEHGGHRGGCQGAAPVGCCGAVAAPAPASCSGGNGCSGGCHGGLFRGGLFHRNRGNGCCGAAAAPDCCPAPAPAPAPVAASCGGGAGCNGGHGGLLRGGLFHRNHGCAGGTAVACSGCGS